MNFLDELEGLLLNKLGAIKTLVSMTKLEARLARLSLYPLILCLIMIVVVLITAWVSSMLLIAYSVWIYSNQISLAFLSVVGFNLVFLMILRHYLLINLRKMSFEKTRKHFDEVVTISDTVDYEREQTTTKRSSTAGSAIAKSNEQSE